jgi:hypothetical protein
MGSAAALPTAPTAAADGGGETVPHAVVRSASAQKTAAVMTE